MPRNSKLRNPSSLLWSDKSSQFQNKLHIFSSNWRKKVPQSTTPNGFGSQILIRGIEQLKKSKAPSEPLTQICSVLLKYCGGLSIQNSNTCYLPFVNTSLQSRQYYDSTNKKREKGGRWTKTNSRPHSRQNRTQCDETHVTSFNLIRIPTFFRPTNTLVLKLGHNKTCKCESLVQTSEIWTVY